MRKGKKQDKSKGRKRQKGRQISVKSKITAIEQSRNQHHKKQKKKEKNKRKQKKKNKEKRERRERKRESRQSSSDGCENGSKWTKPRTDRIITFCTHCELQIQQGNTHHKGFLLGEKLWNKVTYILSFLPAEYIQQNTFLFHCLKEALSHRTFF